MRVRFLATLLATCLCGAALPAHAEWKPRVILGAVTGVTSHDITVNSVNGIDAGGYSEDSDYEWSTTLHLGRQVSDTLAIMAEGSYIASDGANLFTGFLVTQYKLPTGGPLRPYVEGGPGFLYGDDSEFTLTGYGLKGAVGIDYAVNDKLSIVAEAQYAYYFSANFEGGGLDADLDLSSTTFHVGVAQQF